MAEKCFCHLEDAQGNTYVVKDKEARERIAVLEENAGSGGGSASSVEGLTPLLIAELMSLFGTNGSKGLTYNVLDDHATCTGRGSNTDIVVEIGGMAQGLPVTKIEINAFYNQIDLGKVVIPASVIEIGESAFAYCDSIGTIELSEGLITIGAYAFNQIAYNLKHVEIPNSVTHIGNYAFGSCFVLESVRIGKGVTSIGDYVFNECIKLTDIYYAGTEAEWNAITKGANNFSDVTIHYNS